MDFFQHQQRARRKTGLLVTYFLVAVVTIIVSVDLALLLIMHWSGFATPPAQQWPMHPLILWASGLTILVIGGGTALKSWQLRRGGVGLATLLGARRIDMSSQQQDEKRLINVVEEMSIAAGIPTPQLFVLDQEDAINAFVAGFRPSETVLCVTRGTLNTLNRDELQGVIAHEFSHIFNADMRLNLRLIAILAGILAVGKIGQFLLQADRSPRSSSSNRKGGGLVVAGLALMIIGYVGLFFGRLIKAAISRQRELLADASAVQFTRNPAGLAGALIQIRNGLGSHLHTRHAEDMSHMCFGETLQLRLNGLLATHPPLDERLAALGNEWVARARVRARQAGEAESAATVSAIPAGAAGFAGTSTAATDDRPSHHVATVNEHHMGYARSLLTLIPEPLYQQLHQPQGAEQMLYALLMSVSNQAPEQLLANCPLPGDRQTLLRQCEQVRDLGSRLRLPLMDLALPTLKGLPKAQRLALLERLQKLVAADQRQTLFEWALLTLARQQLGAQAGRNQHSRFHRYGAVAQDLQVWFSVLTWASGARDDAALALFQRSTHGLLPAGRTLLPLAQCPSSKLDRATERLQALSPLLKAPVLDAAADLVMADNKVQVAEIELLRTLASLLECPLPAGFSRSA
ncbi:MAG: M48 family metallopeptidase [Alcanivorax sp.]|nr:M48 family metallopeptidase [Alcanivorax sp.]